MRRFLLQTCFETLAEGVEFSDGSCAVSVIRQPRPESRNWYASVDVVEAACVDLLATLTFLDEELRG